MTVNWIIKPLSAPTVLRSCSRCGGEREFLCSGKFRINAQRKNLDVWLIYRCAACASTWNMAILARVKPQEIDTALYAGFLENSAALSLRYAFDTALQRKNGVRALLDDVDYAVEGDAFPTEALGREEITLHISAPYGLNLRLDRLLRDRLGMSRKRLEECFRQGVITCPDAAFNPEKPRLILRGDVTLRFGRGASVIIADCDNG